MFSQSYPQLVKGLMGNFKVSGLNHWSVFGEIDQSSVNKLPFIPKRKLKKKEGVHSPEYLEGSLGELQLIQMEIIPFLYQYYSITEVTVPIPPMLLVADW